MKHIVMTGGTSGLGAVAVKRLARSPGATVHLGARRPGPRSARTFGLDLARLEDVRGFAAVVGAQVAAGGIDGLVLNAGATFPHADGHTPDGFETTFAVNHLAHYLMLRLLLPRLNPGAAVVMTSSGTHDPAQRTVIPLPGTPTPACSRIPIGTRTVIEPRAWPAAAPIPPRSSAWS
jgi:NAD(P)-dependent dehydrogenase (short-subunit alcohol dehydrogenase family)